MRLTGKILLGTAVAALGIGVAVAQSAPTNMPAGDYAVIQQELLVALKSFPTPDNSQYERYYSAPSGARGKISVNREMPLNRLDPTCTNRCERVCRRFEYTYDWADPKGATLYTGIRCNDGNGRWSVLAADRYAGGPALPPPGRPSPAPPRLAGAPTPTPAPAPAQRPPSATAAPASPALVQAAPAPQPTIPAGLSKEARTVASIQGLLRDLRYYDGELNGEANSQTREALQAFAGDEMIKGESLNLNEQALAALRTARDRQSALSVGECALASGKYALCGTRS